MRTILIADTHSEWNRLEAAAEAGIDAIHLRDKQASTLELLSFARRLRALTLEWGVSFYVNERIDIALSCQADGVHLPEESLSPRLAKELHFRVGVSIHSLTAAKQAEQEGADYLFCSPLDILSEVIRNVSIPVYAIGGITPETIPSGAYGIAAISAFLEAPDTAAVVRRFRQFFFKRKPRFIGPLLAIVSTLDAAERAIAGGADAIQFRHKGAYTREHIQMARLLQALSQAHSLPFFINDRVDIALSLGAHVHLGQTDLPLPIARRLLGPDALIGATVSNLEEALIAEQTADYLGIGHIFPTQSKQKTTPPLGLAPLRTLKENTHIPLIAIGGISAKNVAAVLHTGIDGVAILSGIDEIERIKQEVLRARRAL